VCCWWAASFPNREILRSFTACFYSAEQMAHRRFLDELGENASIEADDASGVCSCMCYGVADDASGVCSCM